MKLYNLYLTKKIVGYFAVIVSTLVLLIWFSKAVSFIRFITDKGIKFSDFLNLFLLILPWLMLIIIPISLFIAVLTAYNQMSNHNELTILKNSGLNKSKLSRSALWVAVFCCLLCYFISFFLMPFANKKLHSIRDDFEHNYANLMITPGIFENLNGLTIYVKTRDSSSNLSGILIYDNRGTDNATIITAKSGTINQDDASVLLYLNNGTAQRFNRQASKSDILNFDSYVVNLSDNSKQNVGFRWKAQERYINELINPNDPASPEDLIKYQVELHQRIVYPLFSLILTLIATASVLSGKFSRHGNLRHNIIAIVAAIMFIISIMTGYNLIEKSPKFIPLLYADLVSFFIVGRLFLESSPSRSIWPSFWARKTKVTIKDVPLQNAH